MPSSVFFCFRLKKMMKLAIQVLHGLNQELKNTRSFLSYIVREAAHLTVVEPRAKRIVATGTVVCVCLFLLLFTCNLSNSLALTAFTHLVIFDLLSLIVALTSVWASKKSPSLDGYTLGYERFEVVAVFSATILAILSSFFEIKEAVERIFEPAEVNAGLLVIMCPVAFLVHVLTIYGIDNPAFDHVILASGSSWLQEHTTDISRTLCRFIPGLARVLLPRVNPFALVGVGSSSVVLGVYWLMQTPTDSSDLVDPLPDTLGCLIISLMLFGTMIPMMLYSGRILLQTVPAHLVGPLDKAFREASTIDGVLELRNEHVWSVGFGNLAGSLYVRVRRDADEQLVLAHVTSRLSNLVKYLTVQVYKDDWTRTSATLSWPPASVAVSNLLPIRPLNLKEAHMSAKNHIHSVYQTHTATSLLKPNAPSSQYADGNVKNQ
ncbi:hypothetical protein EG68_09827 [Paragonimus skrjabini miyazakii]|uniref:Cation efflux protein transmembrane domain-containing protein n=1 Tax=Paragonimus skrjabini miyazakii TaxID=59628 RepID=A0A8S9YPI6_9TREM|nr:hypothetical protein EG68_09827 [Paragonimus skrjabini miyazakii]